MKLFNGSQRDMWVAQGLVLLGLIVPSLVIALILG